ncbi:hypothetical protein NRI_0363 [Neorickettsia risticii str. Illinois]|uniref:Uncharacterized protein n=1 Tax=Neorickettsia risticii (strain Illinois) TaxID=434131 RepID=C6V4N3_NEORI|nr:hypothetical protein NRI_0363 [Neorickettsia risticii str. Illinois]
MAFLFSIDKISSYSKINTHSYTIKANRTPTYALKWEQRNKIPDNHLYELSLTQ